MKKSYKRFFVIAIASVLMLSLVPAISFAASTTSTEKTDKNIKIESKEKTIKYKITWKTNGGKIGSKKTVTTYVKRGSKINKLATSPKRSGFSFKGWYTKKTGGTKITKNTKPTKSVTYYSQWTKKLKALNSEEKKLVGKWYYGHGYMSTSNGYYNPTTGTYSNYYSDFAGIYIFNADGTYVYSYIIDSNTQKVEVTTKGKWTVATNSKIQLTSLTWTKINPYTQYVYHKDKPLDNQIKYYLIENQNGKTGIKIDSDLNYINSKSAKFFVKS